MSSPLQVVELIREVSPLAVLMFQEALPLDE